MTQPDGDGDGDGDELTEAERQAARRIADRGRDAVVERLRPLFADAASTHADVVLVPVGPAELERMVQAAADRADGVLWRRALAGVAAEELGLTLGEAISHPLVRRAHELAGAPVYGPDQEPKARPDADPEPADESEPEPAGDREREPEGPFNAEPEPAGDPEREPQADLEPDPAAADLPVHLTAVHVTGIETLREGARNIELRFSDVGLDVFDPGASRAVGRLTWEDVTRLELSRPRSRRMLRRSADRRPRQDRTPRLLVGTDLGQAHFDLSELNEEQAREHLAPVFARTRGAGGAQ